MTIALRRAPAPSPARLASSTTHLACVILNAMRAVLSILTAFTLTALPASLSAQAADPDHLLMQAIGEQQRGDFRNAILDYRKVLELRPNSLEAKVNLGVSLDHAGDFDSAIATYQSVLLVLAQKNDPRQNDVRRNLALVYLQKRDFKNAAGQFDLLHKARPNDVGIVTLLGYTEVQMGQGEDAVALLAPLETANARNSDFEFAYGSALIKAGRRRDGVERLENAAKISNGADAYFLAGSTLLDLNDFEPALRDLEAALRLDPKLPGIYTLTGTARDKTGAIAEAEAAFREALKINPDDFDANLYLGAILSKRRDLDEARPYLERALRLNPSSSMAGYEMGMLDGTAGKYEVAVQELEKVAKIDPTWLEPHVELATLYYKLHRPEDGKRERETVDRLTAEQQSKGPGKP